ncbi:hypothetical protein MRB53_018331 [Persea americana]|uniref:Uncharacterized protein n=1 Tax=Persea americana TaxID=3435 RepID=A0ACC2M756_PERAE|nr:hypothetical protein MRB53_018331 [Persea americana]
MADDEEDSLSETPSSKQMVLQELKDLWSMTLPITSMNLVIYLRAMLSVLCLGRLGSLELAGGALAIGFTNITGYSVLFGLASGLEPICSQAFGSKNWDLLSLSLRQTILILLITTIPISLLWINIYKIMVFIGQEPDMSTVAATFCLYSLPDLAINALLQPLRVYLRSQGVTRPMVYCAVMGVVFDVPMNVVLVFVLDMGVVGVAVAAVVSNLAMVLLLVGYVWWCGVGEVTIWRGWWRVGGVERLWGLMELALPSCLGVCLEWWWYEIMTVLAGYLQNAGIAVATTAVLIQTTNFMYTLSMGLSSCVSTRVGNELGAGEPTKAKLAAMVALGSAFTISLFNITWTAILRHQWPRLFTNDEPVLALAAAAMPLVGLCELGNCPQMVGCGVLRGTARPAIGATINLVCFYIIGTPVAVALMFWLKLGYEGLWYGLLSAQVSCALLVVFVILKRTDWEGEANRAKKLTDNVEIAVSTSAKELEDGKRDGENESLIENG